MTILRAAEELGRGNRDPGFPRIKLQISRPKPWIGSIGSRMVTLYLHEFRAYIPIGALTLDSAGIPMETESTFASILVNPNSHQLRSMPLSLSLIRLA